MAKIRLGSNTEYRIEVNDNGDFIVLDKNDPSFPYKMAKALTEVENKAKQVKAQAMVIEKQKDKSTGKMLSKNEYKIAKLYHDFYCNMRNEVDKLFGKGASDKIYGERNWVGMFADLWECLQPHMEKVYKDESGDKIKQDIINKYKDEEESEII